MCIVFSEPNTIMYCKRINRLVSGWIDGHERHQPTEQFIIKLTASLVGVCWQMHVVVVGCMSVVLQSKEVEFVGGVWRGKLIPPSSPSGRHVQPIRTCNTTVKILFRRVITRTITRGDSDNKSERPPKVSTVGHPITNRCLISGGASGGG